MRVYAYVVKSITGHCTLALSQLSMRNYLRARLSFFMSFGYNGFIHHRCITTFIESIIFSLEEIFNFVFFQMEHLKVKKSRNTFEKGRSDNEIYLMWFLVRYVGCISLNSVRLEFYSLFFSSLALFVNSSSVFFLLFRFEMSVGFHYFQLN